MMFAVRLERNIAQQHDLVIAADLFDSAGQMNRRVLDIAVARFLPRARDALRRVAQPFARGIVAGPFDQRSEEQTSERQSLMRNLYAVFCLKKNTKQAILHDSESTNFINNYTISQRIQ